MSSALTPNALAEAWIQSELPNDPIHKDEETRNEFAKSVVAVQNYQHCPHTIFPSVGEHFGLRRFIPTKETPIGKAPICFVDGAKGTAKCCVRAVPSFLYE